MNPFAPARSAPESISSSSKVVSTSTGGPSVRLRICRVASMPSVPRILRSMTTTSTGVAASAAGTSLPSEHSATTWSPSRGLRMRLRPERTSSWSSTSRTRVGSAAVVTGVLAVAFTGPSPRQVSAEVPPLRRAGSARGHGWPCHGARSPGRSTLRRHDRRSGGRRAARCEPSCRRARCRRRQSAPAPTPRVAHCVPHRQADLSGGDLEVDLGGGAPGVLDHVRQGFLGNAVQAEADRCGEAQDVTGVREVDRLARCSKLFDELGQVLGRGEGLSAA